MIARPIILVSASPLPSVGGIQTFSNALISEAIKYGINITVISTKSNKGKFKDCYLGATIYRLKALQFFNGRFPVPSKISEIIEIVKFVQKSNRKSVLVIQGRFYVSSVALAVVGAICKRDCTIIDHGAAFLLPGNGIMPIAGQIFERIATSVEQVSKARFLAISKASSNFLRDSFGINNVKAIGNGASVALLTRRVKYQDRRPLQIIFCGRLIRQKGVLELIRGFALYDSLSPGRSKLTIIGDGPFRHQVEDAIQSVPNIVFVGAVSHNEAIEYIAESDIVVSPSVYPEGFPSISLESGALGRALCATTYGGGEELVVHKRNAYVLKSTEPKDIAQALLELQDSKFRRKLGLRLRQNVAEHHAWTTIMLNLFIDLGCIEKGHTMGQKPIKYI